MLNRTDATAGDSDAVAAVGRTNNKVLIYGGASRPLRRSPSTTYSGDMYSRADAFGDCDAAGAAPMSRDQRFEPAP
jgi:hypothetical protein